MLFLHLSSYVFFYKLQEGEYHPNKLRLQIKNMKLVHRKSPVSLSLVTSLLFSLSMRDLLSFLTLMTCVDRVISVLRVLLAYVAVAMVNENRTNKWCLTQSAMSRTVVCILSQFRWNKCRFRKQGSLTQANGGTQFRRCAAIAWMRIAHVVKCCDMLW